MSVRWHKLFNNYDVINNSSANTIFVWVPFYKQHTHAKNYYCPKDYIPTMLIVLQDAGDYHGDKTDLAWSPHTQQQWKQVYYCAPSSNQLSVDHTNAADLI